MKIAGIIPARFASTRLPGKPLLEIKGKPMIQRIYEQCLKSKLLDYVVVATDDKRIFQCVQSFGGNAVMTSVKHQSGTDRIAEAARKINCNIVVNVQGDEPFIPPENIDLAIKQLLENKKLNVSTLAIRFKNKKDLTDPNKVKVVMDNDGNALYFSRSIIPYDRTNSSFASTPYYKHIGLYAYRKPFLMKFTKLKISRLENIEKLEQLRILENGEKIKVAVTKSDSVSVDTREDLKAVNR